MGDSPVLVSQAVYDGIMAVRDSGKVNMFDYQKVARLALKKKYSEAAYWIVENHKQYGKGIFFGFTVKEEVDETNKH